jgi:type IV pilus assembly protein PilW
VSKPYKGFGLIELMVALTISSLLIVGAVTVYTQSRKTYAINETAARLQENARYILSILEPDIQLAGYYGYSNAPIQFNYIRGGVTTVTTSTSDMLPTSPAVPGLGTTHTCGTNYAVNLLATIEGRNNAWGLGVGCDPLGGGARPNTDTLIVRRASTTLQPAGVQGNIQLLVSRLSSTAQFMLADGLLPATPALTPDRVQLRDLLVNTYYISQDSNGRTGLPALRRKFLINAANEPAFRDEEVMPGVEDLQVQFGIDTGDYNGDGALDPGVDSDGDGIPDAPRGIATRYVNPDFGNIGWFQVVSVRVWLLMRAEQLETGFRDNTTYQYADAPARTPNDNFRRMLFSRTFQLRNARPM